MAVAALVLVLIFLQSCAFDYSVQASPSAPIDVVYTWVDSSDPAWAALRAAHKHDKSSATQSLDSAGEILLSLASVEVNWPWVRLIHIATALNQTFPLTALSPSLQHKIRFVDHASFIPSQYLPTFSAPAIEAHLHRIPLLSKNFIYQNDDFFACPLLPSEALSLASSTSAPKLQALALRAPLFYNARACKEPDKWAYSLCNVRRAFKHKLPHIPFPFLFWHGAYFLTVSAYTRTWEVFGAEMHQVSSHKGRYYQANVQPVTLVMNVAVGLGLQEFGPGFRWKGFGNSNATAFEAEVLTGGIDQVCSQGPLRVITFFHQALAKASGDLPLRFCRAGWLAWQAGFNAATESCLCSSLPFGKMCSS